MRAEFDKTDETTRYCRTRNFSERICKHHRPFAVNRYSVNARILQNPRKSADYRARIVAVSYARNVVERAVVANVAPGFDRRGTYPENSAEIKVGKTGLRAYGNGRFESVEHYVLASRRRNAACVHVVGVVDRSMCFYRVKTYKPLSFYVSHKARVSAVAVSISKKSVIGIMRAVHECKFFVYVRSSH